MSAQVDKAMIVLQSLAAGTRQPAITGAISQLGAAKQKFCEGAPASVVATAGR